MKSIYNINVAIVISILLCTVVSCTKDFEEINTNPNMITQDIVKVNGLLTQVEANAITGAFGGKISDFVNFTNPGDGGFPYLKSDYSDKFDGYYTGYLSNTREIIRLTEGKENLSNKNAIGKILSVWLWQTLTDRFGDIPFSQATLGVDNAIIQPKYDTQESIYRQLFVELKNATAQLNNDPAQESYGGADLLFNGEVDGWIRFANSLRLRMAMRVRYVDQALAQENIADVINAPLITSDEQSAKLLSEANASVGQGYYNPFRYAVDVSYTNALRSGFTPIELLVKNNDPRLSVYYNISALGAEWRGAPVNITGTMNDRYTTDSLSLVGDFFRTQQYRYNVLTAAEVSFLKAEAALFGLASGDPQSFFTEGIQRAMEIYSINQADINTFLASAAGTLSGTDEERLKQIIDQKYIALIYQADEAWAEYRRTGYPLIWIGPGDNSTNGTVPRRLTYAFNEYLINQANVEEAAGRLNGGDVLMTKVWWDAKSGLPYQHPKQGVFPPETW
jgi:hypothetical protein